MKKFVFILVSSAILFITCKPSTVAVPCYVGVYGLSIFYNCVNFVEPSITLKEDGKGYFEAYVNCETVNSNAFTARNNFSYKVVGDSISMTYINSEKYVKGTLTETTNTSGGFFADDVSSRLSKGKAVYIKCGEGEITIGIRKLKKKS